MSRRDAAKPESHLAEHRRKRDLRRTGEPRGDKHAKASGALFVVHKHAARQLHFDLRLELDGVLKSWAVPKGPSSTPGDKRLAVHVEDHPLEYGAFEGVIPKKEHGGGTVMLWDRGEWRPEGDAAEGYRRGKLDFTLTGERLEGGWTLVRMAKQDGGDNWLLIKRADRRRGKDGRTRRGASANDRSVASDRTMAQIARDKDRTWKRDDEASNRGAPDPRKIEGARKATLPRAPDVQLATRVDTAPDGDDWIHEIKLDGYRVLARLEHGRVRLLSRNGKDWSRRFAEIARLTAALPVDSAVLDGEVVALAGDGATSFKRLQEALAAERTETLIYELFDVLYLDGYDLRAAPLRRRKEALLDLLESAGPAARGTLRYVDHVEGRSRDFLDHACEMGLEGIVSKRSHGAYRSGRGRSWLKVKCSDQDEFLIGGYSAPAGTRSGFGALLLGAWSEDGELVYTGRVGTSFTERQLGEMLPLLKAREQRESPFAAPLTAAERRGVHWVRPELVADVEFTEWTRHGKLRHPSFRGLREDREPEQITLERRRRPPVRKPVEAKGEPRPQPPRKGARAAARRGTAEVAGVRLTHPDRVLYPEQGITKLELAGFYEKIADWILPHLSHRPLSLLRCPEGHTGSCFFQKHPGAGLAEVVKRIPIEEKRGRRTSIYVDSLPGLIALVQLGVLELHTWGCRVDRIERPDTLIFDLDPGPGVSWRDMIVDTQVLIRRLEDLGLPCFVKTTGGKGLHVTVPLARRHSWDAVKTFARAVAKTHARERPERFTATMSRAKRRGKIFIDYLRNGRGATAIAPYSTRAHAGAPVAVPLRLDELRPDLRSDRYTVGNLRRRLNALDADPWAEFERSRARITRTMRAAVGLE